MAVRSVFSRVRSLRAADVEHAGLLTGLTCRMAEQRFGASDRLAVRIRLFRRVGEVSTDIDEGKGRKFAKSVESG